MTLSALRCQRNQLRFDAGEILAHAPRTSILALSPPALPQFIRQPGRPQRIERIATTGKRMADRCLVASWHKQPAGNSGTLASAQIATKPLVNPFSVANATDRRS
jgi:hypothetical protein